MLSGSPPSTPRPWPARRQLQGTEELTWLAADSADLLAFERPGGWVNLTNFSTEPAPLPANLTEAEFVLGSTPGAADAFAAGSVPGSATIWLKK